jgi:hypothetical protein
MISAMKRMLYGSILAIAVASAGLLLAALFGRTFLARAGDPLAAASSVALAALAGAVLGLAAGVLLAKRIPAERLGAASGAAVLVTGLLGWVMLSRNRPDPGPPEQAMPRRADSVAQFRPPLPPEPELPAPGTPDSLLGLITMAAESLPRFETRESQYEVPAVTVYGRRRDWFLVGLKGGGRAWVHSQAVGRYHAIENLVQNRLNYLTESWDGMVRASPSAAAAVNPVAVPGRISEGGVRRDVPANVVEATTNADGVWLKVEVLNHGPCESGEPPKVIATGWIPTWSADGRPTAWFYSRGC